jgi:hypothetical protein
VQAGATRSYRELAEAAWRWVLDHVAWDDGPWVPQSVADEGAWREQGPPRWRDGMHEGIGGLAHTLAEVRRVRAWTDGESTLAEAIADRITHRIPTCTDASLFDGLASDIGVLVALGQPRRCPAAVDRLLALARADGWPQVTLDADRVTPDARINDVTLGTAGVLLAALWAGRHGAENARILADHAANVLMAEAEPRDTGITWRFVPSRHRVTPGTEMPGWSHGLAGIAAALALAGAELDRPELTEAARAGAEHLVTLGDTAQGGLTVPLTVSDDGIPVDPPAYGWCHGAAGTSLLFLALHHAGVSDVAGEPPLSWHRRCLHTVRASGLPQRRHPGFWDNDGRCCGTAGVGDVFLDSWSYAGNEADLDFAVCLGDALVARAEVDGDRAYWRFVEHRNADPVLPPGVGWMQGAAGIAAYLFRLSRVLESGPDSRAVARMDNWWALPLPGGAR